MNERPTATERGWASFAGPQQAKITGEVVRLVRRHTGRGPTKSRATVDDHVVVGVLREVLTPLEHTLIGDVVRIRAPRGGHPRSRIGRSRFPPGRPVPQQGR